MSCFWPNCSGQLVLLLWLMDMGKTWVCRSRWFSSNMPCWNTTLVYYVCSAATECYGSWRFPCFLNSDCIRAKILPENDSHQVDFKLVKNCWIWCWHRWAWFCLVVDFVFILWVKVKCVKLGFIYKLFLFRLVKLTCCEFCLDVSCQFLPFSALTPVLLSPVKSVN